MNVDTSETLLKSALEKIVYFEARSTQLSNDFAQAHSEIDRLKNELAQSGQREIELRRVIAELEVRTTRAHSEREEFAGLYDALRRERADLISKMLDASRLQGDRGLDDFDLAQFIAQLRSEVLLTRDGVPTALIPSSMVVSKPPPTPTSAPAAPATAAARFAQELKTQGRLSVSEAEVNALTQGHAFPGRSEETLFGFSVRELSSPDVASRIRAAERLLALGHPAGGPAIATALHAEHEPRAQVALLAALAGLAKGEAVPVLKPLLGAPSADVRIAALKAFLKLDPAQAGPHLASATRDADKSVRRRASLLALGLSPAQAIELGTVAIADADADVRSLAALVLGASASHSETARSLLLEAIRDPDVRVRRSAAQALSSALGRDLTSLVTLDDAQRRREVRRLANPAALEQLPRFVAQAQRPTPATPERGLSSPLTPSGVEGPASNEDAAARSAGGPQSRPLDSARGDRGAKPASVISINGLTASTAASARPARVAVLEVAQAAPTTAVRQSVLTELRAAIRGKTLAELTQAAQVSSENMMHACGALLSEGAIVRRGLKYFVA